MFVKTSYFDATPINVGVILMLTTEEDGLFAILTNDGTITNTGAFNNANIFENTGTITNDGSFSNSGDFTNTGDLTNSGSGTLSNSGTLISTGTFDNDGSFTNLDTIINDGAFDNSGDIFNLGDITNNSGGSITSSGTFDSLGTITNDGDLINTGTITNGGTFTNTGTFTNSDTLEIDCDGDITGTVSGIAPVDTCDPVADAQSVTTDEDDDLEVTLTGSNPDTYPDFADTTLIFTVVTQPLHGALLGTAPDLTYAPDANFHGRDSFTFTVNDGTNDSTEATVSITVNSDDISRGGGGRVIISSQGDASVTVHPESYFAEHPLERIQVSGSVFRDAAGASISQAGAGQQLSIRATFANHQETGQDYAFIVQITDEQGFVVFIGGQQGMVESGQTAEASTSWTPEREGSYAVQIFVWGGVDASPVPLSTVTVDDIDVT